MKTTFTLVLVLTTAVAALALQQSPAPGSQAVDAYQVIGNIYYVGATDISSHVISTPAGLILLDTGSAQMLPVIRANVEKLGFRVQDIKIILSSHAHWDHVEGHAAMQALTGAEVMAVGEDATAIASGVDNSALGAQGWKPVKVNRILKDGESVTLGGVTMQALLTPGHTKGCTTWTTTVQDGGRSYRVVFVGGISINEGVKLVGNTRHPGIIEDYARTFRVLKDLNADVFLAQHPNIYGMAEKVQRLKAGGSSNPFIDLQGYQRAVSEAEGRYLKQLAAERAASR
ncbi:MAG: subclass B3 metallo-beta-lactamase [Acidobacteria bacterium]|nr:MAG: subclass B3 metallo-beta-lactamase [Acidobacteriota bacterium]